MTFVGHEKQFLGGSLGLTHGKANDKCIILNLAWVECTY